VAVLCVHERNQSSLADRPPKPVSADTGQAGGHDWRQCHHRLRRHRRRYAFIGAGAVVRGDVPDYALMLGVPAVQRGWMSRHGHRMSEQNADGDFVCPESGWLYRESERAHIALCGLAGRRAPSRLIYPDLLAIPSPRELAPCILRPSTPLYLCST